MQEKLNICVVGALPAGVAAMKAMGHTVFYLPPTSDPFCNLPEVLEEEGFKPDLVLQVEFLGHRKLLQGLESIDCPTVFWAMDPHLNLHWHSAYARLFDLTLSTQRPMVLALKDSGVTNVHWLPMHAYDCPATPIADRKNEIGFVGRLSEQRPARQWLVDFIQSRLKGYSFPIEQSLSHPEMMAFYQNTKIIPNESILGEVNFRLFEGTSCGSLVLTQDLGDEQASLFEPGREIATYKDAFELEEKLTLYLGNDRLVQAMGRAAYERVQNEHLAQHRIESILQYANGASKSRATGQDAKKWLAINIASMWESGMMSLTASDVLLRLSKLSQDVDVAVSTLRIQARAGMDKVIEENLTTLLAGGMFKDSIDLNLAASSAALRVENWDAAKAFWYRHLQAEQNTKILPPNNPKELLSLWAKELKRKNRVFRGGFPFNPEVHLPYTAMDCLVSILDGEPEDVSTLKLVDAMLRSYKELDQARIGFLSILTLHERQDWRFVFELAMANFRCCRLEVGMEELKLAIKLASEHGQEKALSMALKARGQSRLMARLGAE